MRQRLDQFYIKHAHDLTAGAGRVRQRPQDVEDRAHAQFAPRTDGVLHRAVQQRREQEADAGFGQAALDGGHVRFDVHAQRLEHVRAAGSTGHRAVAVLGHREAASRRHDGRRGGDVERARVIAAGAAGVNDHRAGRRLDARGFLAHHPRAAGNLVDRLALDSQRNQKARHLRRRGFTGHDRVHGRGRLIARQVFAGDE